MKKMLTGIVAVIAFSSCTQVAGWFGSNDDSTAMNSTSVNAAFARDESITAANAYSDLFLDSNAVERFIQTEKLEDSTANTIRNFYKVRNYQYAWFASDGPTEHARGLWSLHASEDSGSRKEMEGLATTMDSLLQSDSLANITADSSYMQTELGLTQQFIDYAAAHPEHIKANNLYYMVPAKKVDAMSYADSLLNRSKDSLVYATNSVYTKLREELRYYYGIAKSGGWGTIPSGAQLKKGSQSPAVASLKKRLMATMDYAGDTTALYTDSLAAAVKNFQTRHNMQPTGIVTDSMISILNIGPEERVRQILVNMNRALWMPPAADSNRIEVNLPSQMLYVFTDSGKVLEMPVIVGKEGDGTVMFTSAINQVVFNPTWNIPESIVEEEILPKMKADAGYLKKNNMEIVGNGDSVPVLRQLPGKNNPLGKVKFLFPNTHDIYLHDTPHKNLFAKSNRALSHGCIRVGDAAKLATFLLGNSQWNDQKVSAAMAGNKEQTVKLDSAFPVAITYFTTYVMPSGVVRFENDIYGHDKAAIQKMFL